jgi:basic membrane lipoprotein Med (substrate-binding protein (PBP1-ABC) superfamily)
VDSPITVVQAAEKRSAYSVGYHYLGVQKFAPKSWIGGIAFTWGHLYTRFAKQVMDGTWKSENIQGGLGDDYLTLAPFGPAVSEDAIKLVNVKNQGAPRRQGEGLPRMIRDSRASSG